MKELGEPLQQKLAATRRWWRATRLLGGLAWMVCVVVALGLVCFHLDRALVLSAGARQAWRIGIGLAGLGTLLLVLLRFVLRPLPDKTVAVAVERRYPLLRERLLTLIDLAPALAASGAHAASFSVPMVSSLAAETERDAADLDFRRAVSLRPLRVAALTALFTLILLALHLALAPEAFAVWLRRMASPYADIAPFASTRLWALPDAEVLPRGESLTVRVITQGAPVELSTLRYRATGDGANAWKTIDLRQPKTLSAQDASLRTLPDVQPQQRGSVREFRYRFPNVTQSLELYATARDGRSNARLVTVEDRPTLLNMRLTLHFPAYTHRGTQVLAESTGNIAAPAGTTVEAQAIANKPLRRAHFQQENGPGGDWKVEGEKASGSLSVWKDGSYTLALTDRHGFGNPSAPRYTIRALKDQAPSVQITRPATDIDLVPNGSLPLVARATDDYGVASMRLAYDGLRGEEDKKPIRTARGAFALPGPNGTPQANVAVRWNIGSVKAKPGDILRYEVQATDGDTIRGPNTGRSLSYRIHVVSLTEMQLRLKQQLDEEARAIAQLRQRQIEAQQALAQAQRKPNQEAVSRAQEAQRSVAQETRVAAQRINELSAQLENNNLATPSEMQRRDAAQQTLQRLAQQKMPAAADAIARSRTQAERQESEIRHEIEKAQQLLSRTPPLDQLAAEASRLAQEQQRLGDSARSLSEDIHAARQKEGPNARLSPEQRIGMETERKQQAEATADTKRLQQQLTQAAKAAQERGDTKEAQALQRALKALQKGNAAGNQQQAQKALQQNRPGAAAPSQDRAASALQKAAEAAQQAASQVASDSPQAAADRLEQAAERLRALADKQREVAGQVAQNPNAQQSRQLAQQERSIQNQAEQVQQNLRNAEGAQQSLQNAQQSLSQSAQQLSRNNSQSARSPSQNAQQQLQRAAQQAARAAQQLRQQQAANEMRERIERLAQIQHGLQQATQRLGQRKELDRNERRELDQMAARQERVEYEARDLADRFPSPAFKQALRMASRQMHPATMNLNHNPPLPNEETVQAQGKAARTLDTIAQALRQQAQGSQQGDPQQGGQSGGNMSAQEAQEAEALGELLLARGLQQQLRQDTGALDQARARNKDEKLTVPQQREVNQLTQGQRDAQSIAEHAGEMLNNIPGVGDNIKAATQQMSQAAQKLLLQQTGRPTQAHQDEAARRLDQAANQAQQAMQQQQQQQQAQQQAQQGAPRPGQRGSQPPTRAITRLQGVQRGAISAPESREGRGFGALPPRAQRTLREGQQERVPAEFQELVDRYYRSLAEKKR
ncbi:MAG TPA: DUF4175 family protein [Chthonomonadaceae bacterium]|nr:DUF4175 family protein [Chthonomonadaceae bacterium]